MKSTIRVKHDYQNNEPFIQLKLDAVNPDEEVDLADSALIQFTQKAAEKGLRLVFPDDNKDNRSLQIRIAKDVVLWENSEELKLFLEESKIEFEVIDGCFSLKGNHDLFILGQSYGYWQSEQRRLKKEVSHL